MIIFAILAFFISLAYFVMIMTFRKRWNSAPEFIPRALSGNKKISVVVAFRNEIANLPDLINSLKNQDLDQELFEVVLCDDGSDDGSGQLAEKHCGSTPGFSYCKTHAGENGKKTALKRGIAICKNDIIVLTDADCVAGKTWLSSVLSFHDTCSPSLAAGLVDITCNNNLSGLLQEMEFLSLTGSGAAATLMKRPIFCSGANLSYSKAVFSEIEDPLNNILVSGDDTFLMHNIKKKESGNIMLVKSKGAIVTTKAASNLTEFFNQRLRWSSKAFFYKDKDAIITAVLVFLINAIIVIMPFLMPGKINYLWLMATVVLLKVLADFLFLKDIMLYFGKRINYFVFITGEVLYPIYSVTIPFMSLIRGFTWKGRKH